MDDAVTLLLTQLKHLLDPVSVKWEVESLTPYGEMALRGGHQQQTDIHTDATPENVLDRWVIFLASIPERFPYATPAEVIWCVERFGMTVMRDLTIGSGQSFGPWWVTKCWIDEMIAFNAEKGGFMESKTTRTKRGGNSTHLFPNGIAGQPQNQYNNGGEAFTRNARGTTNGPTISIPGPMDTASQAAINAAAGHDDSGIGMRTPDDDFSMSKFNFGDAQMSTPQIDAAMNLDTSA